MIRLVLVYVDHSLAILKVIQYTVSLPPYSIHPPQQIQNVAAQFVFNLLKFSHTTPIICSIYWLSVATSIKFKTLIVLWRYKKSMHKGSLLRFQGG